MTAPRHQAALSPDRERGLAAWWARIVEWRSWPLTVKLVAVLLVPVVAAAGLGVLLIGSEVGRSNSYTRVDRIVSAQVQIHDLLKELEHERTMSAQFLGGTGVDDAAALDGQGQRVDQASARAEAAVGRGADANLSARFADVSRQVREIAPTRAAVRAQSTDAFTAQTQYTSVINALLRFDQALVSKVGDPALSGSVTGLYNLASAGEQIDLQHAVIAAGIGRGRLLPDEVTVLQATVARGQDRFDDFRAVATAHQQRDFDRNTSGPDADARENIVRTAITRASASGVAPQEWNRLSDSVTGALENVERSSVEQVRAISGDLQERASDLAGILAVLLTVTVVLAAAILTVIGRQLLRSVGVLRGTALDVAHRRLPAVVAGIRDGKAEDVGVERVPVDTREELGELARAVEALQEQTVRLAVEQAGLRDNLNTTYVNVSRRSQGLVEHLLRELEQLESNEEDPDQLSTLFKLDHLATRMRRNNENLVVLSGNHLARRSAQPLPLADVLRAAVSEIDEYQRVVVRAAPSVLVAGYVSGDLVRLLAELLDNAGSFSSPETQVTASSEYTADGRLVVEILDEGIGMGPEELREVNENLAARVDPDAAIGRQMGLFVVGRLAVRHSIEVRLSAREDGLRAAVTLPAELLTKVDSPTSPVTEAITAETVAAVAEGQATAFNAVSPSDPESPSNGASVPAPRQHFSGPIGNRAAPEPPPDEPVTETRLGFGSFPDTFSPDSFGFDELTPEQFTADPDRGAEPPNPAGLPPATSSAIDLFTPARDPEDEQPLEWPDFAEPPTASAPPEPATGSGWFAKPSDEDGDGSSWFDTGNAEEPAESTQQFVLDEPPQGFSEPDWDSVARDDSAEFGDPHSSAYSWPDGGSDAPWARAAGHDGARGADVESRFGASVSHWWDPSGGDWPADKQWPVDEGWQAAQDVAEPQSGEETPSGLPKRQPRAQLLPGSAEPQQNSHPPVERDGEDVRGRLNSFQSGVRNGRHRRADSTEQRADGTEGERP